MKTEMNRFRRQEKYEAKQRRKGMVMIKIWVPRSLVDSFKVAARKARKEYGAFLD